MSKEPDNHNVNNDDTLDENGTSRRAFLSKGVKRAAYIAPVVWSLSAREALAGSDDGSAFGSGGGGGPLGPAPE